MGGDANLLCTAVVCSYLLLNATDGSTRRSSDKQ